MSYDSPLRIPVYQGVAATAVDPDVLAARNLAPVQAADAIREGERRQRIADAVAAEAARVYGKLIAVKAQKDRDSYNAFRKMDQELFESARSKRVAAVVRAAEDAVKAAGEYVAECEPAAVEAKTAHRNAEDRAAGADRLAADKQAEHERVKAAGTAEEILTARGVAQGAAEVRDELHGLVDEARVVREAAESDLAEARSDHAAAVRDLDEARRLAVSSAGRAPLSDVTVKHNFLFMQSDEVWVTLSDDERRKVHQLALPRDVWSSAEFWARIHGGE